ncbi:MAG: VOC family protein [Actinomycetota bacterium]|nr:VOC family protein [Actinomycetota bacterium]
MRITLTSVFVDDQRTALDFYTSVLGLEKKHEVESPRDWWRLQLLRGWSHDRATTTGQVPGGDAPTCGADGA